MRRSLWLIGSMCVLVCSRITVPAVVAADESVALFEDDFSRYPPGPLTAPLGKLNGAIQEYHYLPHRGVDAWPVGQRDLPHRCLGRRRNRWQAVPGAAPRTEPPGHGAATFRAAVHHGRAGVARLHGGSFGLPAVDGRVGRRRVPLSHEPPSHRVFASRTARRPGWPSGCRWRKSSASARGKELGTADFPYETNRYYRLRVENDGPEIRAFIDDKLVLTAMESDLAGGKVGLSANTPAALPEFPRERYGANQRANRCRHPETPRRAEPHAGRQPQAQAVEEIRHAQVRRRPQRPLRRPRRRRHHSTCSSARTCLKSWATRPSRSVASRPLRSTARCCGNSAGPTRATACSPATRRSKSTISTAPAAATSCSARTFACKCSTAARAR